MASKRPTFGGEGPDMLRGTCILPILGTLLVALRLVTANRKAREVRWDAVWIGIGIVWAIASYITFAYSVSIGIGNHVRALTYSQIFEALRWTWVSIFVGLVAGIFAKLAIIALLLGVQPHSATKTRTMLWGLGILLAATNVTQIILTLNKCKPLAKLWNPTIEGVCPLVNVSAQFSYYQGGIHAFADIFLSLFPITIVWNLQASKKVKIGFCALMASGSIPSVAVITRTTLLKKLSTSKDITYDFGHFMLWATLELWTVVIINKMPTSPPASAFLLPSFQYVPAIPTDDSGVEAFLKGFVLPAQIHAQHDKLSRQQRDTLRRQPDLQKHFTGARKVDEILVLICGHGGRDQRCGIMGPVLTREFEDKLNRQGVSVLQDAPPLVEEENNAATEGYTPRARLGSISHIGGHKFAGNVIIYIPPDFTDNALHGKGIWYGRVEPRHVEGIVEKTVMGGKVIRELFRGGIGQSGEALRL
ncbi:Sucrase/ferredoxin-like protein 2 [Elsinoe fawcettii]|nr:Sucrase/ferredoxin-like protein 2 [Elsinoe fawcettii]